MKLSDLLDHDRLLLVTCHDCLARIPLDPAGFALRLGVQTALSSLKPEICCPACASRDVTLSAYAPFPVAPEPVKQRVVA